MRKLPPIRALALLALVALLPLASGLSAPLVPTERVDGAVAEEPRGSRPRGAPTGAGAAKATDAARALSGPFALKVSPGGWVQYKLKFKNTGKSSWRTADGYGFKNLTTGREFPMGRPVEIGGCDGLPPGWTCTWRMIADAGLEPGPRTTEWRYSMHRDGEPFGGQIRVKLKVRAGPAVATRTPGPTATPTPILIPPAPALVSPADGATLETGTPQFRWGEAAAATSYTLSVLDGAGVELRSQQESAGGPCWAGTCSVYLFGGPLTEGSYGWRVRAASSYGTGPWSETWGFIVDVPPPPPAPALLSPADRATLEIDTPQFEWGHLAAAESYTLSVLEGDVELRSQYLGAAACSGGSCSTQLWDPPLPEGSYRWRVRASNPYGTGPWSQARSFTVDFPPPPASAPTLLRPADGATVGSRTPTFEWQAVPGASRYSLRALNGDGAVALYDDTGDLPCPGGTCSREYYVQLADGRYTWHVRGKNAGGEGPWSAWWGFTVTADP